MSSYSAKGGVLVKQFISERMSRDYAQELAVITEVLEAILADTGYPNIGCLMISRPKNGTLGQLLEAQIGEVDEDRHDVFLEHIKVHSELCGEIIGRLTAQRVRVIIQHTKVSKRGTREHYTYRLTKRNAT